MTVWLNLSTHDTSFNVQKSWESGDIAGSRGELSKDEPSVTSNVAKLTQTSIDSDKKIDDKTPSVTREIKAERDIGMEVWVNISFWRQ